MRTRAITVTILALLTAATATGCAKSQAEIAGACSLAFEKLDKAPHKDDPRPPACEGLNDEDYNLIHSHKVLKDAGLLDK
ncbi:hypothetical protein [Streptomyces wuyuanensis]|uniref:hypothetical protein n=1 Tax=Streptomyces wuyuanensis TaxID=1196353 RepID=UPI0037A419B1